MLIPKPIEHYLDVPGFNNPKHLDSLAEFAAAVPENARVLEIGAAWGCTTWVLMTNLPKGSKLHTCDTFGMNHPALKQKHYNGVMKKHSHNSAVAYGMHLYMEKDQRTVYDWTTNQHPRRFEILKKVHQVRSLELLAKDKKWDMVYIDGLHSYENVKAELKYLKDVPMLCGDDYHPVHPGSYRAINEFLEQNPDRKFEHHPFESDSGWWKITYA